MVGTVYLRMAVQAASTQQKAGGAAFRSECAAARSFLDLVMILVIVVALVVILIIIVFVIIMTAVTRFIFVTVVVAVVVRVAIAIVITVVVIMPALRKGFAKIKALPNVSDAGTLMTLLT